MSTGQQRLHGLLVRGPIEAASMPMAISSVFGLHGLKSVAPLKRRAKSLGSSDYGRSPRAQGRGPIEGPSTATK